MSFELEHCSALWLYIKNDACVCVLCTHSIPFVGDVLWAENSVWIDANQLDAVGLSDLCDFILDAHDGHALLVGFWQGGLELIMSCDQTLKDKWGD